MIVDVFEDPVVQRLGLTLPGLPIPPLNSLERYQSEESIDQRLLLDREHQREIAKERFKLAPIRVLPREILAMIFELWMHTPLTSVEEKFGLHFLRVCRLWRHCFKQSALLESRLDQVRNWKPSRRGFLVFNVG